MTDKMKDIIAPLQTKMCFPFILTVECLSFTGQNEAHAGFDICRLFSHSLVEVYIFFLHTENQILTGGPVA